MVSQAYTPHPIPHPLREVAHNRQQVSFGSLLLTLRSAVPGFHFNDIKIDKPPKNSNSVAACVTSNKVLLINQ